MTNSRSRKTGFVRGLFAGCALLVAGWGDSLQAVAAAQAHNNTMLTAYANTPEDGGGGGSFAIFGATYAQDLKFSKCMRSHGVPNFPDQTSQGDGITFSLRGMDPNPPQFQRAEETCQKLSPFPGGAAAP